MRGWMSVLSARLCMLILPFIGTNLYVPGVALVRLDGFIVRYFLALVALFWLSGSHAGMRTNYLAPGSSQPYETAQAACNVMTQARSLGSTGVVDGARVCRSTNGIYIGEVSVFGVSLSCSATQVESFTSLGWACVASSSSGAPTGTSSQVVQCGSACTVTLEIKQKGPFSLSVEDGLLLSGMVISMWLTGLGIRAVIRALSANQDA
jgi:hypothetical protein